MTGSRSLTLFVSSVGAGVLVSEGAGVVMELSLGEGAGWLSDAGFVPSVVTVFPSGDCSVMIWLLLLLLSLLLLLLAASCFTLLVSLCATDTLLELLFLHSLIRKYFRSSGVDFSESSLWCICQIFTILRTNGSAF